MQELFNFKKKSKSKSNQVVQEHGNGYMMPNGSTIDRSNLSLENLNAIDWVNDFPWVIISKFKARYMAFSPAQKKVFEFDGDWLDGHFVGGDYTGAFKGQSFEGNYKSKFFKWQTSPYAFVEGTIADSEAGILGVKKINPSVFDSSSSEKSFSLLQVPKGYYVNITDSNGYLHSFKVVKTLDSANSFFTLESQSGAKHKVNIAWSILRGGSQSDFEKNTTITVGKKPQIPLVFDGDMLGKVVSVEVSPKGSLGKSQRLFKFNTTNLGYGIRPQVITLFFDTDEEVASFKKLQDDITQGQFNYHMKNIVNGLKFNAIDGYGKNIYLTDIFAQVQGKTKPSKQFQVSLDWLEQFVRVFVLNIVKSKRVQGQYVDSPTIQRSILNPIAIAVQNYLGETQPTPPKKRTPKKGGGKKPSAIFQEGIRKEVFKQLLKQK